MLAGAFTEDHYVRFRDAVSGRFNVLFSLIPSNTVFTAAASDGVVAFTYGAAEKPATFDSDFPHATEVDRITLDAVAA